MIPSPAEIEDLILTAIRAWDEKRPRSLQRAAGQLGPSAIGFCRQQALLTLQGVAESDSTNKWAACLGTATGEFVENGLKDMFPDWIIGTTDKKRITVHLRNGASITGQPDVIVPAWNAIIDLKTKDGYGWVRREPWSQSYRFQTWLYCRGACQMGLLDPTKPLYVGLAYLDRSGQVARPYVVLEEFNPGLEDPICEWIDDVIYAHVNKEDASRDIPAPVCEQICEYFSVCRGDMPMAESTLITDDHLRDALVAYEEGRQMEKAGIELKMAARDELRGVNGTDGTWTVRWVHKDGSFVPGYEKQPSDSISVTKARGR